MYEVREAVYRSWDPWNEIAGSMTGTHHADEDSAQEFRRVARAQYDVLERVTRRYMKRPFGLHRTVVDGALVDVHEEAVVQRSFCRLLHFRRDVTRDDPRVLIVPPMSGHFSTLVRGTIEALLPQHDVFVCDWADARTVPIADGHFDLDDYTEYLIDFLATLGPGIHVLGVCQAAVPALMATALTAAGSNVDLAPLTLTLMAGPIDCRMHPTTVNDFATRHSIEWFEATMLDRVPASYPGGGRHVYPGFFQLGAFMAMNPDKHYVAQLKYYSDLVSGKMEAAEAHRAFYDEYLTVMDMTAEFYLQSVRDVFQQYRLATGSMTFRGAPVEPAAIHRTALMTIEGERDDITGRGQTEAAQALCSSIPSDMRAHLLQPGVGHFGVFSGRRWRAEVMPQLAAFIRAHPS